VRAELNNLDRYLSPGPLTDPRHFAPLLANLPPALPELCQVVQGLMIHVFWAERYGTSVDDVRAEALQHRSAAWKLGRILELDARDLITPRPVDRRLVGNCRDFTLLLVTFLRHQGVPARARCLL
jgi:transglutaminase-like putative cysteine protease